MDRSRPLLLLLKKAGIGLIGMGLFAMQGLAAAPYITAAIHWSHGKAQFFLSDGTYVRYDIAADRADVGYPKRVSDDTWPGMGAYGRQIVAAANGLDPNKVYFFLSNGEYLRYDVGRDCVDSDYPRAVTDDNWPGLAPYAKHLFGAVNWNGNMVHFFLNDGTYVRFDLRANRVSNGYPRLINSETWPGLGPYALHISGSINWDNGKAYIFLDDGRYLRYDVAGDRVDEGYPKLINNQTWPGLANYFRRR